MPAFQAPLPQDLTQGGEREGKGLVSNARLLPQFSGVRLSGGLTSAPVLGILSYSAQLLSSREGFGTEQEGTGPGDPSESVCTLSGHDMTVRPHLSKPS